MILLDIDYFKAYNDYYGHIQGDACLQHVAQIIKNTLTRPRDVVARFGGEEFAIILPDTNETAAIELAERLMQSIEKANIAHEKSEIAAHLTVSLGLKTQNIQEFDEKIQFLKDVDSALYKSKSTGRNRFMRADHAAG